MLLVAGVIVIAAASFFALKGDRLDSARSPQAQVQQIWARGLDTSRSLFTPEETVKLKGDADARISKFLSGEDPSAANLVGAARLVRDLRDFDQALALFAVVDTMKHPDLFYRVDMGRIYLDRQQWEEARQVFEPMKDTWPVHEAYLGLAEAYEHIDGIPDYVIDQIYEESVWRNNGAFEVLEAYAKWLEQTGREEKTLPYYEEMNRLVPQKLLEDKIAALKAKYKK